MKQKTAMQELKELVASGVSSDGLGWWLFVNMDRLVEKEKCQIMDAWYNGFEETRPYVDHSEDYYNETYKQD